MKTNSYNRSATDKQIAFMQTAGIDFDDSLTIREATNLITDWQNNPDNDRHIFDVDQD